VTGYAGSGADPSLITRRELRIRPSPPWILTRPEANMPRSEPHLGDAFVARL
jgi:hypothetical protein